MENASKALIMAAEVLVGVIILTIAVTLFRTFSDFGKSTYEDVEQTKIAEWNNTYLKYFGTIKTDIKVGNTTKEITIPITATAHDIVTVANSAMQNNINYEIVDMAGYDEHSFYVQVDVDNVKISNTASTTKLERNFEKKNEEYKNNFLKYNDLIDVTDENGKTIKIGKLFKVVEQPKISPDTKKVIYIKFEEFAKRDYIEYYNNVLKQNLTF